MNAIFFPNDGNQIFELQFHVLLHWCLILLKLTKITHNKNMHVNWETRRHQATNHKVGIAPSFFPMETKHHNSSEVKEKTSTTKLELFWSFSHGHQNVKLGHQKFMESFLLDLGALLYVSKRSTMHLEYHALTRQSSTSLILVLFTIDSNNL